MEAEGAARRFPVVGRAVGVTLELMARSIGARRVFELGSGFGYSAYWFARAVGPAGEVRCTDADRANATAAQAYLSDAGLGDRVTFHVGGAVEQPARSQGDFDAVFCDIDKPGYPDAWRAATERIRPGGLYLCDNTLGTSTDTVLDDNERTRAIREHNRAIAEDPLPEHADPDAARGPRCPPHRVTPPHRPTYLLRDVRAGWRLSASG